MAHTIPSSLPSRASKGEERLFNLLKRLPDEVIVYYEPYVDNRHPDFVVILPRLGVLLIEVKGWYLPDILAADSHSVRIRDGEREVIQAHPLRQVRDYKFLLMNRCSKDKQLSLLTHRSGAHEGGFQFPFGSFAVLSNITRDNLQKLPENVNALFPQAHVATRDELLGWEELGGEELMGLLQRYFDPFWPITPMTPNQVNIVKAILHPEILLALAFQDPTKPQEPTVKVLDLKQEELARDVGSGHRLIFGVAGSGKTVLLIARAKLVARLNPSANVLVLCYNVAFSTFLSEALKDCVSVKVLTFHAWARANGVAWDRQDDDAELGSKLLAVLQAGGAHSRRFDTILIDEAQDFEADWYRCVLQAMKEPVEGELLIVGDGSQGVYRRRKLSWKQLGIQAAGRTQYLERNYRSTQPIVSLATIFAAGSANGDEDEVRAPWVDPSKCVRLLGSSPVLLQRQNKQAEVERVVRIVGDLLVGLWFGEKVDPLKPEQIGILYPRLRQEDRPLIHRFCDQLKTNLQGCPSVWLTETQASRRRVGDPGVKILTMHSSKGLQFKAVILLFADECPAHFPDTDEAEERCLFYVALTRAEDFLAISSSRKTKFINEIEQAGATSSNESP